VAGDAGVGALQQGCFACAAGYVLVNNACNAMATCTTGQGPDLTTNVCRSCSTGCLSCPSNYNTCTSCNNTANYFLSSGSATTCTLCQIYGCTSCRSLSQCQTCRDGLILVNGACTCADGTYMNTYTNTCPSCSIYCLTCSGPSSY
jgi:hypothetical protein